MMYASPALMKQNVAMVLAVNDGCCSGPFHSDQSCFLNKLCSFPTNMLHVCFGSLFSLRMYCFFSVLFMSTPGVSEASFRFLCTRGVMEVVLLSNKIVHHPALKTIILVL